MSRGRKKSSLRDLSRRDAGPDDVKAILEYAVSFASKAEVPHGTDRVIAISMSARVEQFLEQRIWLQLPNNDPKTMERLHSERGPLSTFSSKIEMAYALAAIDRPMMDTLNRIRTIRNAFAHAAVELTFDTMEIAGECRKLGVFRIFEMEESEVREATAAATPRQHFVFATTIFGGQLLTQNLIDISAKRKNQLRGEGNEDEAKILDELITAAIKKIDFASQFKKLKAELQK